MTDEQKLWAIADTLRGKMNADEFRDYILGFTFYKYLSERLTDKLMRLVRVFDDCIGDV